MNTPVTAPVVRSSQTGKLDYRYTKANQETEKTFLFKNQIYPFKVSLTKFSQFIFSSCLYVYVCTFGHSSFSISVLGSMLKRSLRIILCIIQSEMAVDSLSAYRSSGHFFSAPDGFEYCFYQQIV